MGKIKIPQGKKKEEAEEKELQPLQGQKQQRRWREYSQTRSSGNGLFRSTVKPVQVGRACSGIVQSNPFKWEWFGAVHSFHFFGVPT